MATSGDSRNEGYRGGLRPAAGLVIICLVAASCQSGSSSIRKGIGSPQLEQITATHVERASVAKHTWCKARPNAAWRKALRGGVVAISRRASVVPLALATDGRSFFASIYTKAYSGVVRIDATSSRFTKIKRYPDSNSDQASGSFDGRWLVWAEYHSLYDTGDFSIWSWDSRTGRLRQIGSAARSPSGEFWTSAWQAPVAFAGYATWEQGSGQNNVGDIHVVDLESGRDHVVHSGRVGGSFLIDGPLVVWPESIAPGALTIMRTAGARTGRIVAAPPALRKIRGGLAPVTDGEALAFIADSWTSLWWSPSLRTKPRIVISSRDAYTIDNSLQVAGRYVFFGVQPRSYFADGASGRYLQINKGGWARLNTKVLVLLKPSAKKASHGISDIVFLPLKSLPPIPPCR